MSFAFSIPEWVLWLLAGWGVICLAGFVWFLRQFHRAFFRGH